MSKTKSDKFEPIFSTQLFGLESYFTDLVKLKENHNFPKVLLLTGDKGSGKFTLSFHLLNFFFSDQANNSYDIKNRKINTSSMFYKNILSNVNENFAYIGKSNNKNVGIDEIRDIKKKLSKSSLNNLPKFTILDDVELLNSNAANALLKLIEEPSSLNYLILINNKRNKMIDTLKSRSIEFKIFLKYSEKEKILNSLSKKFNVDIENYSNFIEKNSPGLVLRICECLNELDIKNNDELGYIANLLLDKYKKDKNEIYLETLKFFIDFKIYEKISSNKSYYLKLDDIKREITKRLIEFEKFNLSKGSVLQSFKELT